MGYNPLPLCSSTPASGDNPVTENTIIKLQLLQQGVWMLIFRNILEEQNTLEAAMPEVEGKEAAAPCPLPRGAEGARSDLLDSVNFL